MHDLVGAGVDFEPLSNSLTFECRNPQLPQHGEARSVPNDPVRSSLHLRAVQHHEEPDEAQREVPRVPGELLLNRDHLRESCE